MRKKLSFIIMVAMLSVMFTALGACAGDETLNIEKASKILKPLVPELKIISVAPTPVHGVWEVAYESQGQKSILYLDGAGKYILAGNLVEIATKTNLTRQKMVDISRVDVTKIKLADAMVLGDEKAAHRVVVFDDPE